MNQDEGCRPTQIHGGNMFTVSTTKAIVRIILIVLFAVIVIATSSETKNRFNVFVYQDLTYPGDSINNYDSFYFTLDSFGASHFYTLNPKIAAENSKLDTGGYLDIKYYSSYFYGDDMYIGDNNTFDIFWNVVRTYNLSMLSTNLNVLNGYKRNRASSEYGMPIIDNSVLDIDLGYDVLWAQAGVDPAGLLHGQFVEGVFHLASKGALVNDTIVFEVFLKIGDTAGNDDDIIAKLMIDDVRGARWAEFGCLYDTTREYYNKNSVQKYNDTLLIIGTSNGADTVTPLSNYNSPLQISFCADLEGYTTQSFDLQNICYVNPLDSADTVCSYPFRFLKEIKRGEFPDSSGYHSFKMTWIRHPSAWSIYAFKIYWTGIEDLYLDSLKLYNDLGVHFYALVDDSLTEVKQRIEGWYSGDNADAKNTAGFYIWDEMSGAELQSIARFYTMLNSLDETYPNELITTLGAYNNPVNGKLGSDYFKTYIQYTNENYFVVDMYPNDCKYSSSSDTADAFNIQTSFNAFERNLIIAKKEANETNPPVDFWVTLPTFAITNEGPKGTWVKNLRLYTAEEYRAIVNLCLSYGASGIGYWTYVTQGGCESTPPDYSCDDLPKYYNVGEKSMRESGQPFFNITAYNDSLVALSPSCSSYTYEPYRYFGLVDRDANNDAVPTPLWDSIRTINMYLDSMAYFFLNADWIQAGRINEATTLSGTFIDSIKSDLYDDSLAFIHVAFFEKDFEDYAYITNRRVQRGQHGKVDTQTVDVYMPGEGRYELWDIYENSCDTVWDSAGVLTFTKKLDPGEAVLMKTVPLNTTWSGTWDESWLTWPDFSTVRLVGDLTIPAGKTLSLNSIYIRSTPYSDSLMAGSDTAKVEIIVEGELRTGGGSGRTTFTTDGTTDSSWYGIRVQNSGKIFIDNSIIKNAYTGIRIVNNTPDTIKNTRFENCFMYGIRSQSNDNLYLVYDSFFESSSGYGIWIQNTDSSTIINKCYFEDVKYAAYFYYYSNAILDNSTFIRYIRDSILSPAITVTSNSGTKIRSCEIRDYQIGVKGELRSNNMEVIGCTFDSDSLTPYVRPRMYIGIQVGRGSNCRIRGNCFNAIDSRHVYEALAIADLGVSQDLGNNSFNYDSAWSEVEYKWEYFPEMAFEHGTLCFPSCNCSRDAWGNFWDPIAVSKGFWISCNTDTSESRGPFAQCFGFPPGGAKFSELNENDDNLPLQFSVSQNYPNPFNPSTVINFTLPENVVVTIEIFNVLGQKVITLVDRDFHSGEHQIVWPGTDQTGRSVSSGIYFYRIVAGDNIATKKMMLLK